MRGRMASLKSWDILSQIPPNMRSKNTICTPSPVVSSRKTEKMAPMDIKWPPITLLTPPQHQPTPPNLDIVEIKLAGGPE